MTIPIVVHEIVLYSTALISVLGNGLLMMLLNHKTSHALGNYRVLLAVFVLVDMATSVYDAWFIPMFVFREYGFFYFGFGAFHLTPSMKLLAEMIHMVTFYIPFFLITIHFIYRYLSLARPSILQNHFSIFLCLSSLYIGIYLSAILTVFMHITFNPVSDQHFGPLYSYAINASTTPYNIVCVLYVGDSGDVRWFTLALGGVAAVIGGHTIVICILCIFKILKSMKTRVLEIGARRLHVQLFRALLIQFIVPLVFSFLPFTMVVIFPIFGVPVANLGNVCSLFTAFFPAIDPLLITVSIPRFRGTILSWFYRITGRKAKVNERQAVERSTPLSSLPRERIHSRYLYFTRGCE